MTAENTVDDKKQAGRKKLSLKKTVEAGKVTQTFTHGRSKTVKVEVRKKRVLSTSGTEKQAAPAPAPEETKKPAAKAETPVEEPKTAASDNLTTAEKAARVKAVQDARQAQEEDRISKATREAEEAARLRREAEEKERAEREAEEARRKEQEEEERRKAEAEAEAKAKPQDKTEEKPAAGQEAAAKAEAGGTAAKPAKPRPRTEAATAEEEAAEKRRQTAKTEEARKAAPARRGQERRRTGKLTIGQALDGGQGERMRSLASVKRAREKEKQKARLNALDSRDKMVRDVIIPEVITVQELANRMSERGANVIKTLMGLGVMATINQSIDADTAELVVSEMGHKVKRVSDSDVEIGLIGAEDDSADLRSRAPVVTVMGHVDHGKTSLLDALRSTDVVADEAGGITQHIGAYQVTMENGSQITFIDTPGHAAFTAMRARGASVTDIVVLVVAADDGIMPQTVEAINHAKQAKAPIIVAINKMDKPDANPDRVRNELLQHELVVEEMGGEIIAVEISAKERLNLDKLEEAILLVAEMMELRANPDRSAEGVVVEAKMERGRGSVATLLVQRGSLNVGDILICGKEWGRVRALIDSKGENLEKAGPSVPVEVLGLNGTPAAGDDFVVVDNESRAREVAEYRDRRERQARAAAQGRGTVEQMFNRIKAGEAKELPVVIKADVQGSVEALVGSLESVSTDEVRVRVLHSAVGGINESDITLARASDGLIIGFNVRANPQARDMAKRDGVDIRYYSVIYNAVDDIKAMLSGMLAPAIRENFLGYAEIREVFSITKVGKVAGCMITEGMVKRGAKVRLLRDQVVIHEGSLSTLRRFKEEVKEVKDGYECGMSFEHYQDIQVGDVIECFEMEEIARAL